MSKENLREIQGDFKEIIEKEDLINEIINIFDYGPEWIYDDFVRRNYID